MTSFRTRVSLGFAVSALVVGAGSTAAVAAPAFTKAPAQVAADRPTLSIGSRGDAVRAWQQELNKAFSYGRPSHAAIAVDGDFGLGTKAATEAFQQANHLKSTGVVDNKTYSRADAAASGHAAPPGTVTSGTPSPKSGPLLRVGSSGAAVKTWQQALNSLFTAGTPKHGSIATDGAYGPATAGATEAFQSYAKIGADGVVGPNTYQAAAAASGGAADGADVAKCTHNQLTVGIGPGAGPGAGTSSLTLIFKHKGPGACSLTGFPGVSYTDSVGHQLGEPATRGSNSHSTVVVSGNKTATASLRYLLSGTTISGCDAVTATFIKVFAPGTKGAFHLPTRKSACKNMGELEKQVLSVRSVRAG